MVAMLVLLLLPLTLSTLLEDTQCDGMEGAQCPMGCCPMQTWFCCRNLDFCAETEADCETLHPCPPECGEGECFGGECYPPPISPIPLSVQ